MELLNDVKVSFARSIANLAAYILAKEVNVSSNPLEWVSTYPDFIDFLIKW